jgi:hypothetical protein
VVRPLSSRDEVDSIRVSCSKASIERGQTSAFGSGELRQVCVRHLPVAQDAVHPHIRKAQVVRPENVARILHYLEEKAHRFLSAMALPDQKANHAALSYRAGSERIVVVREPDFSCFMVNVLRDEECDQNVGVEERNHSSSSSAFTSSEVMTLPA